MFEGGGVPSFFLLHPHPTCPRLAGAGQDTGSLSRGCSRICPLEQHQGQLGQRGKGTWGYEHPNLSPLSPRLLRLGPRPSPSPLPRFLVLGYGSTERGQERLCEPSCDGRATLARNGRVWLIHTPCQVSARHAPGATAEVPELAASIPWPSAPPVAPRTAAAQLSASSQRRYAILFAVFIRFAQTVEA